VVVLLRDGAGWQVLTPQPGQPPVMLGALPRDAQGRALLDVVLAEDPAQRWAVALPTREALPDFTRAEPWKALQEAIASGAVAVVVLSLR
jgi:hypothetical protein